MPEGASLRGAWLRRGFLSALAAPLFGLGQTAAQDRDALSDEVRSYLRVSAPVVALENVLLFDGTGGPARSGQTIVIRGNRIESVGGAGEVEIPPGAERLDLEGHSVMPGMVGLHNHMFYYQSTPRASQMQYSGPRLYLGAGVTTVRTTGSVAPYQDLSLKGSIERGETPGPRLLITAPYVISPGPDERLRDLGMYAIRDEEAARRYVRYWAAEGAEWIKAYTQITREALATIIDEAHLQGMKVTAHLCSVGFREATAMGIDNLEHGLWANSEYDTTREPDRCSPNYQRSIAELDMDDPRVAETISEMVAAGVAMTSTVAVAEQATPLVPDLTARDLEALPDHVVEAEMERRSIFRTTEMPWMIDLFENMLDFELAFVEAGGVLAAGVDPAWGALPGYGDQRNFEILVEAGFATADAVRIVSANGAEILGLDSELGTVAPGKLADLVVIEGDIELRPSDIRNVRIVFKDGLGYDPDRLTAAVAGQVGVR
ncbi:amidohydrolase family protein [Candidatus Palauibacter soopunensis]|uniref:amidohydrolase family protein n=1 Tax=Candidatus Palauibacter soopunensis TaxID=3056739 RepID=UPI0023917C13|nr:amidohydrolase family protein [Candidatus Palauibacter soopunensis]MDE2879074.1 amidohydrolase family protein [Candidatus Palauibacter soopunensis]